MELNQRKPSWKRSFHVSIGILLGGCQAGEVQCGAIEECISVGDQKSKRFTIEFFCWHDEVTRHAINYTLTGVLCDGEYDCTNAWDEIDQGC